MMPSPLLTPAGAVRHRRFYQYVMCRLQTRREPLVIYMFYFWRQRLYLSDAVPP